MIMTIKLKKPSVSLLPQDTCFSNSILRHAAAAAKLLQLCLTLCDPIDGNPPGSPIPVIQPRKPRTTIWSSNSTPGHLSREKHNSNRHMWNLKKAMVCCAVVSWVEKATWCRKAEGEGSPCCFQHRGPRVCWLTAPVLLCLHRSASWKSQWSQ